MVAATALQRVLWVLLGSAAALAIGLCAWLFVRRVPYPFELEWMEGAMVDHSARLLEGQPLYAEPTAEHVPFLYTPLLFWLGALLGKVIGLGYGALRLWSAAATVASAVLIGRLAARESGHRGAGWIAAGLFLGGYGLVDSWYDLARNDTLLVALVLGITYLLRWGGTRSAIAAGILVAMAFLAKQSALMWLPFVGLGALVLDRRRGLWFGAVATVSLGATVLIAHLWTDGWFTFYVFEMPRYHGVQADRRLGFFTEDLLPLLPMVALAVYHMGATFRGGRRREALFLTAFGFGALLTSYLSRLHTGGHINVLMYALAGFSVLAGCALGSRGGSGSAVRIGALALAALQFGLLAYDPGRYLPRAGHTEATRELVTFLRSQPGDVLVPFHGNVAALAGKPRMAHAQALHDLLWLAPGALPAALAPDNPLGLPERGRAALIALFRSFQEAMAGRVSTVVLEVPHGPAFEDVFRSVLGPFRRSSESPIRHPGELNPQVGMTTHSPYVLERNP